MLDKKSKILLKYVEKQKDKQLLFVSGAKYPEEIGTRGDLDSVAKYLESIGKVEWIIDSHDRPVGIRLSHIGRNRKEFSFLAVVDFACQQWIAIAALIVSIVALIKSW